MPEAPTAEHPQQGAEHAEREARREAALAHVRKFGDPVLRSKALLVERFDRQLHEEVMVMEKLMGDAIGIGLAATQLGVMHRVLIYRIGTEAPLVALVNAEIEWSSSDAEIGEEGCLSLPGVVVDVERPVYVRVRAQDTDGSEIMVEASGLEARVVQHEVDHLQGVLMIDRIDKERRREAMQVLRGERSPSEVDRSETI